MARLVIEVLPKHDMIIYRPDYLFPVIIYGKNKKIVSKQIRLDSPHAG